MLKSVSVREELNAREGLSVRRETEHLEGELGVRGVTIRGD